MYFRQSSHRQVEFSTGVDSSSHGGGLIVMPLIDDGERHLEWHIRHPSTVFCTPSAKNNRGQICCVDTSDDKKRREDRKFNDCSTRFSILSDHEHADGLLYRIRRFLRNLPGHHCSFQGHEDMRAIYAVALQTYIATERYVLSDNLRASG